MREIGSNRALVAHHEQPIAATEKGFALLAGGPVPVTPAALAAARPPALGGDLILPMLLLRDSALRANAAAMARWCAAAGVRIAPHGKTTMAPDLFARQLAAGAWAITVATISQARVCREFGIGRILIANEVTDPAGLAWLARELNADPGFDCYFYADCVAGVDLAHRALAAAGATRRPRILVELGFPGGRTGCRDEAAAERVAAAVTASDRLRLAGVAGYEGGLGPGTDPATLDVIAGYCRRLRDLAVTLRTAHTGDGAGAGSGGARDIAAAARGEKARDWIVTAGGSAYFDVVARELAAGPGLTPVLRSGCYITHDHGEYARIGPGAGRGGPDLAPAIELWAPVLSRPEPDLALVLTGRRDTGFDQGFPIPVRIRAADGSAASQRPAAGLAVTRLDDQHAYVSVPPGTDLAPGDLLCLGISHPCTTLDKWRVIPVVDDEYRVIDIFRTYF